MQKPELERFVRYMIGGGVWFWSGYVIIVYLDDRIPLFWANFTGNAVGITLNFVAQRYWAFTSARAPKLLTTTRRYLIYTALNAFGLNFLILSELKRIGIEPKFGQFIAAAFFAIWNYAWYKSWVFRGQTNRSTAESTISRSK
jgi:putative flippase GtrA